MAACEACGIEMAPDMEEPLCSEECQRDYWRRTHCTICEGDIDLDGPEFCSEECEAEDHEDARADYDVECRLEDW